MSALTEVQKHESKSFSEESCGLIDELIKQVTDQRDTLAAKLEQSNKHPEVVEYQQEELRRRSAEIVEGLRTLRREIIRNEVSREEYNRLGTWLKQLGKSVWRLLRLPMA